jgi:hypothetical protein
MKNISDKLLGIFSSILVLFGAIVPSALAEEIVITGNGAASVNEVVSSTSQNTDVTQNNEANINNNIDTNANTGDNTASNNTGSDTQIVTGDIHASTSVENSGNVNVVQGGNCVACNYTISTVISSNGPGSVNTVNNTSNTNISVTTNNTADIANSILTNANTGNNTANNNNGNVSIQTGNIRSKINVLNGPLNVSKVKVQNGGNIETLLKIAGNGVSSINTINNTKLNNVNIVENNIATIINNIISNLNTGGNSANFNNGDVAIATGDIWSEIKVTNLANINEVIVDCGCKPKPGEENPPILPPGITTSVSSGGGSSSSSQPAVQGAQAVLGSILPTTGGNWLLFALIANIMMFFLGAYLRLRSGRSPGFAFAS